MDAALAASAALAVVYPHMCGVGGDLFAIVASSKGSVVVNGSGASAAALDPDLIRSRHSVMPRFGPLTVTVPGAVAAWERLARTFGRLPLSAAIAPAIQLAQVGAPVAPALARAIGRHAGRLGEDPGTCTLFLPDGVPLDEGDHLVQPGLAATLRAIAEGGADAFYRGEIGARLLAWLSARGSSLAEGDLRPHHAELVPPLTARYRNVEVLVPPPNSQGLLLLEILSCVEQGGLEPDHLGRDAGLLAALFLLTIQDRERHLADPVHVPVPIERLLAEGHTRALLDRAREGWLGPFDGQGATADTVGIVVADDELWVAVNHSLYDAFGSGMLEPETGIICHNRGASFSLDPAAPNALAPGKRPAHTLLPVIVARDGVPIVASATKGSSVHPQIHAQLLMALLDRDLDPAAAVDMPRWLSGGLTNRAAVVAEHRVPRPVLNALESAGLPVELVGDRDEEVGQAQLIARDRDGYLRAATDLRADGTAAAG